MLVEDKGLLSDASEGQMEKVAAALDASYSQKFYSILEEAKVGFLLIPFVSYDSEQGIKCTASCSFSN